MNALTLFVDAANAESASTVKTAKAKVSDTIEDSTNGKNHMRSATITPEEKETSEDATTASENRAMAQVLEARARESVLMQQMQQQHGAAAKMRYLEEMRKEEQELLSKERLSVMMMQREREQQRAAMHQATIMRIIGTAGSPSAATSAHAAPSPGMNTLQEAEYLQQLRLESLAQQRRQETLANLAMAPPGAPASKALSKDVATHKYTRQDTALQKAILMARADEELRKQQLEHQQKAQEQIELEHQIELEKHRQQQAAVLHMMSNGDSNDAFVKALRAAAGQSGHGGNEESAILQLLEERERHRLLAQHQQNQHRPFLPQAVVSASPSASSMQLDLQNQLQHHLQARQQHHEAERSDLIGSVFAKVAAAAASANNNHRPGSPSQPSAQQQPLPSQVLSAIAAAEEQEKQKLLQLQQHRQNSQESFQSSGMMIDALSHSQQQRQRLEQQALLNQQQQQQQQAAAMAQQQQESIQLNREMQQKQQSVEQDASFHDSKSTILPCRARGMPMDHNVKTAYFVIPQNIKHGTELLCSYFACRNAGIKFRYCVYCKLPVAKRNFAKRHRHSGKIPDSQLSKDVLTVGTADTSPADDPAPTCTLASPQKASLEEPNPEEKDASGSAPVDLSVEEELSKTSSAATPAIPTETTAITKDSSEKVVSPLCSDDCETPEDRVVNSEEAPTHEAESSKPIQESDSKTKEPESTIPSEANEVVSSIDPSPVVLSPQPTIDTSKRRMEWEELLLKRPKKAQHNSDAMMSWIKDVLRVSDFESEFVSEGSGMEDSVSGVQTDANPSLNGEKKRSIEEARPSSVKKSKKKALLSRKVQEDQEQNKFCDESQSANSNTESESNRHLDEESAGGGLAEKAPGKRNEDFSDDASTSSEESVDLRVRKKARN